MTCRTKVHTREELLHRTMDSAAYILEHPKMVQRPVKSCLERASIATRGGNMNSYKMYLIKCSNKCIGLILSFIFPCAPSNRDSAAKVRDKKRLGNHEHFRFFRFSCILNIKEQNNDCINDVQHYGNKIKKNKLYKISNTENTTGRPTIILNSSSLITFLECLVAPDSPSFPHSTLL
jgi:hypothetical protein